MLTVFAKGNQGTEEPTTKPGHGALELLLLRVITDNAMSADDGHDGHWDHAQYTIPHGRPRSFPGDRGWPDTWPTHGIMPCKPWHPFAPVHPRAAEAGQKPGRPMASCLVNRVTRSHPYIPGRPRLARNLADQWHHAL